MGILALLLTSFLFSFALVVESEGEGCSSDIKKAKKEALKNAKISVVERHVGTLISSKTLIVNSRLLRDIIQTRVLGTVKLAGEPVYENPRISGRDQLCVKVKARFEIPASEIKPANFGLVILLSKKKLRAGERLELELSAEKHCYPYLFSVDAKGRVYRLLPNPVQGSERLKGKLYFPTEKMKSLGYELVVFPLKDVPKPQREEILFICSKKPVKAFEDFFPSAFAEDGRKLKKLLSNPYPHSVERFSEILVQLGAENYDTVDDFYIVR